METVPAETIMTVAEKTAKTAVMIKMVAVTVKMAEATETVVTIMTVVEGMAKTAVMIEMAAERTLLHK
jgi:hypothetical protein